MICTIAYVMINISFQGLSLFMPTVVATCKWRTSVQRTALMDIISLVGHFSTCASFLSLYVSSRMFQRLLSLNCVPCRLILLAQSGLSLLPTLAFESESVVFLSYVPVYWSFWVMRWLSGRRTPMHGKMFDLLYFHHL